MSEKEALDIARKDLNDLVKTRKLVLLVDLDHTIIHTSNEPLRIDTKVNKIFLIRFFLHSFFLFIAISFSLTKDIHTYLLGNSWYHTKMRPGYQHFLDEMHKIFQLHLVTFGERNYAHTIAKFLEKDRQFFHERILSRNEIFNPISKTENIK